MSILDKEVLTLDDVMELLNITRRTLQRWIKDGKIKAVKVGNQLRIPKKYYLEYIEKNTIDNTRKK